MRVIEGGGGEEEEEVGGFGGGGGVGRWIDGDGEGEVVCLEGGF